MKITVFFVCLCIGIFIMRGVSSIEEADPNEEKIQMAEQLAQACYGKDGTTQADFNFMFRQRKLPETRPQKCLSACMHEQFEIIKDAKFQRETFVALATAVANDPKKTPAIEDIGETCEKVQESDRCELALKLTLCYKQVAEKHGLDFQKLQNGEYTVE